MCRSAHNTSMNAQYFSGLRACLVKVRINPFWRSSVRGGPQASDAAHPKLLRGFFAGIGRAGPKKATGRPELCSGRGGETLRGVPRMLAVLLPGGREGGREGDLGLQ